MKRKVLLIFALFMLQAELYGKAEFTNAVSSFNFREFKTHSFGTRNDKVVVFDEEKKDIIIYDGKSGDIVKKIEEDRGSCVHVGSLRRSIDGTKVAYICNHKVLKVFDISSSQYVYSQDIKKGDGIIYLFGFNGDQDSERIEYARYDSGHTVFVSEKIGDKADKMEIDIPKLISGGFAYSEDKNYLLLTTKQYNPTRWTIYIINTTMGKIANTFQVGNNNTDWMTWDQIVLGDSGKYLYISYKYKSGRKSYFEIKELKSGNLIYSKHYNFNKTNRKRDSTLSSFTVDPSETMVLLVFAEELDDRFANISGYRYEVRSLPDFNLLYEKRYKKLNSRVIYDILADDHPPVFMFGGKYFMGIERHYVEGANKIYLTATDTKKFKTSWFLLNSLSNSKNRTYLRNGYLERLGYSYLGVDGKFLNLNYFNDELAKEIYEKIDKNSFVELFQFSKKFSNDLSIVKNALSSMKKIIFDRNKLEVFQWYVKEFPKNKQLVEKRKRQLEEVREKKIFLLIDSSKNIFEYHWYMNNSVSEKYKEIAEKKIVDIVKKKHIIGGYRWLLMHEYGLPEELMDSVYAIVFKKAKELRTISALNSFILAFPMAAEVKEANELACKIEKDKYTDIGTFGFFNKSDKLNKQARKIFIKIKKILKRYGNSIGAKIIASRMYSLLQNEFEDTDPVLTYQENTSIEEYIDDVQKNITETKESNSGKRSFAEFGVEQINNAGEILKNKYIDKKLAKFYIKDMEKFKKFLEEQKKQSSKDIDFIQKQTLRREQNATRIENNAIERFNRIFRETENNYKPQGLHKTRTKKRSQELRPGKESDQNAITELELKNTKRNIRPNMIKYAENNVTHIEYRDAEIAKKETTENLSNDNYMLGLKYWKEGKKAEAKEMFKISCDEGNIRACANLSLFYRLGFGGSKDYFRANKYGKIACNGGSIRGCETLGFAYLKGRGGYKQSIQKAQEIFKRSCAHNKKICKLYNKIRDIKSNEEYNRLYNNKGVASNIEASEKSNRKNNSSPARKILSEWNGASNSHDAYKLGELYDNYFVYYGKTKSKEYAIKDKRRAFRKYPQFHQDIKRINISKEGYEQYRITFDKYVKARYSSVTKIYPSYLVVKKSGERWSIIEEGDRVTDANLGRGSRSMDILKSRSLGLTSDYQNMGCGELWYARNKIFADSGYCFKGQRAISVFGRRCYSPYGRLSNGSKAEVDTIKYWERRRGCR